MTAATAARPLLEAKDLTKRYGDTIALDSVDMQVFDGITGLLGPNGAGKSTAMKLFLGLLTPTSGDAEVLGEKPYENVEVRVRLGYMPEHDCLPDAITASEFLGHMAQMSGIPAVTARTRAADILRHVGLDEERYRHIKEYSTGMKQRVKLAQALVHDPVMVLLDEPTAGLDPGGREEMLRLIRRTGKEFGISIMLSSHLMGDVESTCDRIIVIEGGKIIEQGTVSQFTQETETLYIDVDDRRDEVVAALESRGIEAAIEGLSVVVQRQSDEQFDDIRDAIVDADARLRRLAPSRGQLSDIFRRHRIDTGAGRDIRHRISALRRAARRQTPRRLVAVGERLSHHPRTRQGHARKDSPGSHVHLRHRSRSGNRPFGGHSRPRRGHHPLPRGLL